MTMGSGWRRFTEKVRVTPDPTPPVQTRSGQPRRAIAGSLQSCQRRILASVSTVAHRQAKQKWHITLDRSFPATANARNEAMMREAGDFAVHLKRCEKDIRTLKNATEGASNTRGRLPQLLPPFPLPP